MTDVMLHRLARRDLREAAQSYEEKKSGLGDDFVDAVYRTFNSIAYMPEAGMLHERGMRMRMVKPFSYGVLYRIDDHGVFVLAIGHLSRSPDFWTDRIGEIE